MLRAISGVHIRPVKGSRLRVEPHRGSSSASAAPSVRPLNTSVQKGMTLGAALALDVQAMQSFVKDIENVDVYVAGKDPVQRCMCDVLEALGVEGAKPVDPEISAQMGTHGVVTIAL